MARKSPPPPLNLTLDTRSKRLPQIARDPPMDIESKPLILMTSGPGPEHGQTSPVWRALRIACGFVHLLLSTALLLIVVLFLGFRAGGLQTVQGPGAVVLVVSLGLDIALSLLSIGLIERLWTNCLLCVRLMVTCGYMALLIANALRGVFPEGYKFWGLGPHASNIVALVLLSTIILLNVAQAVIERQALASFARQQMKRLGEGCSKGGGELVATSSSAGSGSTGSMDMGRERETALSRL